MEEMADAGDDEEKSVSFAERMMGGPKKDATDAEERPQTADVMSLVGFDPDKEYTPGELTKMADEAVKLGKKLGLPNEGTGSLSKGGTRFGIPEGLPSLFG